MSKKHMKHHAVVQSARERYISRREEILNNFLRIIFTTAVNKVHARFEPWRDASNVEKVGTPIRGVAKKYRPASRDPVKVKIRHLKKVAFHEVFPKMPVVWRR